MLLLNGDCIEEMQKLIDDGKQVDSVVTDPPYHLTSIVERYGKEGSAPAKDRDGLYQRQAKGFMGKEWDGGDVAFRKETWELAYKLLKPGGHLLAFSASRNYHRMAVAIEDAGFEIRDQIMWIYGSGFPKSLNLGDGWGTALKPAHEPIVMAKKRLEGTNKQNKDKYGTGGINIDGCRIKTNPEVDDMLREVERVQRDESNVWSNKNSGFKNENNNLTGVPIEGRFPANVMHDGSDVVKDIFPKTGTKGKAKYPDTNPDFRDQGRQSKENMGIDKLSFGQTENVKRKKVVRKSRDENGVWTDDNSASRYFYCAKTSKAERNQGLNNFPIKQTQGGGGGIGDYKDDVNSASGKFGSEKAPSKNTHPTVKPIKLMKYLCRLITPKGGTVLDPFMGSGSTGMAAKEENFDFVGIEKEEEYFNIASARIESVETKSTLEGFYD